MVDPNYTNKEFNCEYYNSTLNTAIYSNKSINTSQIKFNQTSLTKATGLKASFQPLVTEKGDK